MTTEAEIDNWWSGLSDAVRAGFLHLATDHQSSSAPLLIPRELHRDVPPEWLTPVPGASVHRHPSVRRKHADPSGDEEPVYFLLPSAALMVRRLAAEQG